MKYQESGGELHCLTRSGHECKIMKNRFLKHCAGKYPF